MTEEKTPYKAKFKYDEKIARRYFDRNPKRHIPEMRLVERAFAHIPKTHRVLDAPCGGGRVTVLLAKSGYDVRSADISDAMMQGARENIRENGLNCSVEKQDLEKMTFPDASFDTIVCFRLFHHLPEVAIRRRIVKELCRVASKNVVMSYFNPLSLGAVDIKFRAWRRGKHRPEYDTPLREVKSYFKENGFRLVEDFAQKRFIQYLHLAVFERIGKPSP